LKSFLCPIKNLELQRGKPAFVKTTARQGGELFKYFFLIIILLAPCAYANGLSQDNGENNISGLAIVNIQSKKVNLEFEQAILVDHDKAVFVALNDFGGETFRIIFQHKKMLIVTNEGVTETSGKKLKKILSLPLSQDEFLNIVRFKLDESFDVKNGDGKINWIHKKKKKMKILFEDFRKLSSNKLYPFHIRMEYKKNFLDFSWLKIKTSASNTKF